MICYIMLKVLNAIEKKIELGELGILGEQCIQSSIWLTGLEYWFF